MERWAANTLRTLGIVFTAIMVICGCLFLFLLGQCAASGGYGGNRNPSAGINYYFGAVLLGLAGITFIAVLARGILRSRQAAPQVASPVVTPALPSEGSVALDRLFWCLAFQLALSVLEYIYSWLQYQRMQPQMRTYYSSLFLVSSVFYAVPYAVLIGVVRQRVSRIALAFAFGVPAAAILQTLITVLPMARFYFSNAQSLGRVILPLMVDIVLVVLAYQAAQSTGLESPASSRLTTVAVAFVYFYVLHLVLPFVYRLFVRR